MNRYLKGISFLLLVLASLLSPVSEVPLAEAAASPANDCAATIMPDSTIHIPAISIYGHTYSADMVYLPSTDGSYWFGIGNIQAADGSSCANPSQFAGVSGTYLLMMPAITVGTDMYRAVLEYDPTRHTTAEKTAQTIFRVDAEMRLRKLEQAESEKTFDPSMLPVQFELNHTQHIDVSGDFTVDVTLKGTVQLGAFQPNNQDGQMSFSYITGPANGTLDIISASCAYPTTPECTCVVKTVGSGGSPMTSGWVTVNSLEISPIVSPWDVTLNYNLGLPDGAMTLHVRCCFDDSCSEREHPWGAVVMTYYGDINQASLKGDHYEATNFSHSFTFSKKYVVPPTNINEYLSYEGNTDLTLWPGANLLQ